MQLALSTTFAPPSIPVWDELRGNLRQGFTTKNQTWNPGPKVINSTTAIGFWPSLILEGVRQSHSARYYNPITGRFVSRDPEDGILTDPGTLHKYTYAGGDPVNWADPTGKTRSATATRGGTEYTEILFDISIASVAALDAVACAANIQLSMDALKVDGSTNVVPNLPTCSAKKKLTCKSPEFSKYIPVNQLWYPFPNRFTAYLEAVLSNGGKQPRSGGVATALSGPCGEETSSYMYRELTKISTSAANTQATSFLARPATIPRENQP